MLFWFADLIVCVLYVFNFNSNLLDLVRCLLLLLGWLFNLRVLLVGFISVGACFVCVLGLCYCLWLAVCRWVISVVDGWFYLMLLLLFVFCWCFVGFALSCLHLLGICVLGIGLPGVGYLCVWVVVFVCLPLICSWGAVMFLWVYLVGAVICGVVCFVILFCFTSVVLYCYVVGLLGFGCVFAWVWLVVYCTSPVSLVCLWVSFACFICGFDVLV